MKYTRALKFIIAIALLFILQKGYTQLDSCNVFLKGNYIEVGINYNGAYGSSAPAPMGYHPKGASPVGNSPVCSNSCPAPGTGLGFVADPDKDGWTIGTPYPYYGDFFMPGTPQEGWSIMANGSQVNAWNAAGCSPLILGTGLTGGNVSYFSTGKTVGGIWGGTYGNLMIRQITSIDTQNIFFTVQITIINTGAKSCNNVYYLRTVDPDNDEAEVGPSGFTTINKIEYQLPNAENKTLVSAMGQSSPKAFLGLGTIDCRARCFIIRNGIQPDINTIDNIYGANNGLGDTLNYQYSGGHTADQGIGLVFKFGDIAPNDSVSFAYAYVLSAGDIDHAFESTKPKWTDDVDSMEHISGDTVSVCKDATVSLSVINGAYLKWQWYSTEGLDTDKGTIVHVQMGAKIKTLIAVGTSSSCAADTLIINLAPNLSLPPLVTDTIFYCQKAKASPLTATGENLRWYYTDDTTDPGTTTPIVPRTDTLYNYIYYVTQTIKGCVSPKSAITVVITPIGYAAFTVNKKEACVGQPVLFYPLYTNSINQLRWDFGDGEGGEIPQSGMIKHSYDNTGEKIISVIAKSTLCPDTTFSDTIHVYAFPQVNLGPDTSLCPGDVAITLTNQLYQQGYENLWSTGASTHAIAVDTPASYWLIVTTEHGCTAGDTIQVYPNCYIGIPNAFSPNGDGINDYFFPRELLSRGAISFKMEIFDRWGVLIFETTNLMGRGWDGKFNGVKQSSGVYIYMIEVAFKNGATQQYKGNVTLLGAKE